MTQLIICEKPSAAERIANALAEGKIEKKTIEKVSYYIINRNKKKIIIGCAVGHLYNIAEKDKKGWTYPVFSVEWKPSSEVSKTAAFSKKYLDLILKLAKEADSFIVASVDYNEPTPILENGVMKIVRIGEIIENIIDNKKNIEDYWVPAFGDDGIISFRPLKRAIRHKIKEDLYEVKLNYGRTIKLTSSHNVFILENGRIKNVKTTDLKHGMKVLCPSIIPAFSSTNKELNFLELLDHNSSRDIFVEGQDIAKIIKERTFNKERSKSPLSEERLALTEAGAMKLKRSRLSKGFPTSVVARLAGVSQPTIVCWENHRNNPTISNLSRYLPVIGISSEGFLENKDYCRRLLPSFTNLLQHVYNTQFKNYSNFSRATIQLKDLKQEDLARIKNAYIYGSKNKRNKLPIKISFDMNLVRILGYYLAEGDINQNYRIRFSLGLPGFGHESRIIKDVKNFCNFYNIHYNEYLNKGSGSQIITVDNSVLAASFKLLLNFGGENAREKRIPSIIYGLPEKLKLEFLQAYFLGDGSVSESGISFNTSSEWLAYDLRYLLLQFGISTSIYTAEKSGKSDKPSWQIIVTGSSDLAKLRKVWQYHHKSNLLNISAHPKEKKYISNKFGNLIQLPIKEIKKIKPSSRYVYDFSVDGENFIAGNGGICCHNTDYDLEGEVIGLNVIRFACKKNDADRMKFSTLTKDELIDAYENRQKHLDWQQAEAGETRHILDWFYGMNLSRALSLSIKAAGSFKIMSSGRVQGPTLNILAERENEIKIFKPEPFWQIELNTTNKINAWHVEDKFWDKDKATKIFQNTKNHPAIVSKISKNEFSQPPPNPFDLTSLQLEAYKTLKISPKNTLQLAQNLYSAGCISYPRTSSNQLPPSLNYKKIISSLKKQKAYSKICEDLLKQTNLMPNNGKKTDPAHPAIYPSGETPKTSSQKQKQLYDLIVRRTLSSFSTPAFRETITLEIDVNKELFKAKGTITKIPGWHSIYAHFVKLKEEELPKVEEGQKLNVKSIDLHEKETQPPKRFTPASIIKELETKNLGTKSTRASVVDSLFQRNYLTGESSIEVTDLGLKTIDTLKKYCPEILDEELTRHFEQEMEQIRDKKKKGTEVIQEAEIVLKKLLKHFKQNELQIGTALLKANRETQDNASILGKCYVCNKGELRLMSSRKSRKKFAACNQYPKCKTTYSIPTGKILPSSKECEFCKTPIIKVIREGKRPFNMCLTYDCKSKETWGKKDDTKNQPQTEES
ncbi:MAG: DNA topoisomerase I [Nanoarchaeota archaeon]